MDVPRLATSLSIDTTLHMVDFFFPAIRRNNLSVRAFEPPIVLGSCRRRPVSCVTAKALLVRILIVWPPFLVPREPNGPCKSLQRRMVFVLRL